MCQCKDFENKENDNHESDNLSGIDVDDDSFILKFAFIFISSRVCYLAYYVFFYFIKFKPNCKKSKIYHYFSVVILSGL